MNRKKNLLSKLGPGLLYAGAAVGVSHLVQSTRAGGEFGFYLIPAIIIIHCIKYPFFEFGPRYTAATGHNILHGYKKLGHWALWVYLIMTLCSMFIIQAAVTVVTAGLAVHIFGFQGLVGMAPPTVAAVISSALLAICFILLAGGRYALLDKLIKIIILVLSVTSVVSVVVLAFNNPGYYQTAETQFSFTNTTHLIFLATFLGWMPAPMDISVWHSIWAESKNDHEDEITSVKEALLDFRIGYFGTALLAICFLLLGALVMYGSGKVFSSSGAVFAGQLMDMYQQALGHWAYPVIAIAALTTMFSTTLTCLDAFPRSLMATAELLFPNIIKHKQQRIQYLLGLLLTITGTLVILFCFLTSMKEMVKIATVLAFVATPVLACLNMLAMFDKDLPEISRPGQTMWRWCIVNLFIMVICSISYLVL